MTYFVLAKQIRISCDQNSIFPSQNFLMKVRSLAAYAEEMLTTIYLHMETKKIGREVFIFVLTIRNKSLYSGKITTYLKMKGMSLNLLTTLPTKENRCKSFAAELMASKLNFGKRLRVTGHEYRKMDYGAALRWGCSGENRFVSKRWHPSFKKRNRFQCRPVGRGRTMPIRVYRFYTFYLGSS